MTAEVFTFPSSIPPDIFRLTPEAGPGQSVSESVFNGAQAVVTMWGSERWSFEASYSDLISHQRAEMEAFIVRLRVARNVFLLRAPIIANRGVWDGSPIVRLSSLSGTSLVVAGATNNVNSYACAGDYIAVNSMLKMVTQSAATNGSGIVSLSVWPPMYKAPNSGTPIVVTNPMGGFRLTRPVALSFDPPGFRLSLSISAVEYISSSYVSGIL